MFSVQFPREQRAYPCGIMLPRPARETSNRRAQRNDLQSSHELAAVVADSLFPFPCPDSRVTRSAILSVPIHPGKPPP